MDDEKININSADEIVIVVPEEAIKDGELEIDLDELGIDVESLGDDVNIVIQVEGAEDLEDDISDDDDEDFIEEPNEWHFDDDPYNVVYYEFPDEDEEEWVMSKEIPYYTLDEEGNTDVVASNGEAYIDDGELKEMLLQLLGDDVPESEIQKILEAASDENLTEEEFDKLLDEFILKNKN